MNRGEADRNAVKRALEILAPAGWSACSRRGIASGAGQLGEIQPGVSLFALREGVVTIPMVMDGTERVVRNKLFRLPKVRVTFGPPLELPGDRRAPVAARPGGHGAAGPGVHGLLASVAEER